MATKWYSYEETRTLPPGTILEGEVKPDFTVPDEYKAHPELFTSCFGEPCREPFSAVVKFNSSQYGTPLSFGAKVVRNAYIPHTRYRVLGRPKFERIKDVVENFHRFSFTSGCDPEFFLRDDKGKLVPAFAVLPAKAEKTEGGFWDGFQAEFVTPPSGCMDAQTQRIAKQFKTMLMLARSKNPGIRVTHESVVEVDGLADLEEQYVALGCSPSHNVYGFKGRDVPDPRKLGIRFAGGHLHFGLQKYFKLPSWKPETTPGVVKFLDATIGVGMVSMAAGFDDPRRREYYGLAGEIRLPAHGLEYRTLSNFPFLSPTLTYLTFDIARHAACLAALGLTRTYDATEKEVLQAINETDVKLARTILARNEDFWRKAFTVIYYLGPCGNYVQTTPRPKSVDRLWNTLMTGPGALAINPATPENNWNVGNTWQVFRALRTLEPEDYIR